ncbi:exodeoxyribonuclease VII large subunit [Anaerobacillus sp. MEB173]|uniref:exodeoxyribonuclease VII large subunit n=1 Tax=Anaerobacillus sp. MEB173 TaxID=3383345 RepID=UPI003F8DA7D0
MASDQFLTISQLTRYIKKTFDQDEQLQNVWVRGEISNFKLHSRGHMYFTIKDNQSRIQSVMFAGNNRYLKFIPENGMNVLVRGDVSVYEPHGQYQFYAKEMQPDGIGNLYLAYEELKAKLESAGLFANELKKPLPTFATEIAVVTSPTGAAIRDIISTLKRRFPIARITLFPVLVQGDDAPASIARAIEQANELHLFDVLIVGRGGGSIEELWAFNEEIVAMKIFESKIPVISAVGHETDYTIADFVADIRAATPTAAAELAVPSMTEIMERIEQRKTRLIRAMNEKLSMNKDRLHHMQKSYAFRYPGQLVKQKEQELDRLLDRLHRESERMIDRKKDRLEQLQKGLNRNHPIERMIEAKDKTTRLENGLKKAFETIIMNKKHSFHNQISKLEALSPLKVMDRGYSLVYTDDQALVKSVKQVSTGDYIQVQVQDGKLDCRIDRINSK